MLQPQTMEPLLKFALIALTTLLSTFAYADLAEVHQKDCEKAEIKELMGETGSCRIVIAPKKLKASGSCTGTFMEQFPCSISYITEDSASALSIICGEDPNNPIMSQEMQAEGISYNVAAIIKTSEGKSIIRNDEVDYKMIQTNVVKISIINGETSIAMSFPSGDIPMTNVSCSN